MSLKATRIGQLWREAKLVLADAGNTNAALDARLILQHLLNLSPSGLIMAEAESVDDAVRAQYSILLDQRLSGVPVARLIGTQEFYGLSFALNADTLIPRPETELLVDIALDHLKNIEQPKVLDLGTGSGCIPIAILSESKHATAIAVDIAPGAVEMATKNATELHVFERFCARLGSWFEPISSTELFDLVVSNPPYINSDVIHDLQIEVKKHDPMRALDGGEDGLDPYRIIISQAHAHLKQGAMLAFEIGYDQADRITSLLECQNYNRIQTFKDLSGLDRVVIAFK